MSKKLIYLISFVLSLGVAVNASAWFNQDVGNPALAGSASYDSATGTWTVVGDGDDIGGTCDQFHYVYRCLLGDGQITVRVASMDVTDDWAKAGLMIRETLDAGSRHAMMAMTGTKGVQFVWRQSTGGWSKSSTTAGEVPPERLRITRQGDELIGEFYCELIPGLFIWIEVGRITIPMNTCVYIGMAVTSHNSNQLCTAVFDNVNVTATACLTPASNPSPPDGAEDVPLDVVLSWSPGCGAESHDVYLGTDPGALALVATTPLGDESCAPGLLESCTVYYWQVNEVSGTDVRVGDVWSFKTGPTVAYDPSPPDGAEDVPLDVVFSWSPGCCATWHDVYLGTNFDDVDNADVSDVTGIYRGRLVANSYAPIGLVDCTTYHWRIDEVCHQYTIVAVPPPEQVIIGGDYTIPGYTIYSVEPTDDCLLADYQFEGNADDSSGNNLHGTLMGDASIVDDPTQGLVATFDGDGDCVDLGNDPLFNPTGGFSISVWINMSSWGDCWGNVIVGKRGEGGVSWQLRRHGCDAVVSFTTRGIGNDDAKGRIEPSPGEWHHIAAIYDGSKKVVYIDGEKDVEYEASGTINPCDHNVYIGARATGDNTGPEAFFNGKIDDLQLYCRALSLGEVRYINGLPDLVVDPIYVPPIYGPLVAHYEFEGDASDSSGNNLHGTLMGDASIVTDGERGQVLALDGDGDYVDCGNPDALNFGTGDWTISLWIKTTESDKGVPFANGGDGAGGQQYALGVGERTADKITLTVDDDASKRQATSYTSVTDDNWHCVVGVRDGSTLRIYVDCEPEGTVTLPAGYDLSGTTQHNALIGAIWNHGNNVIQKYFTGLIDDVRVYDYALSHGEVLYLCGCGDLVETEIWKGDIWSFTTTCKVAVDIDIKPQSCPNPLNVSRKGVLPVAILGSEDLDVTAIDVTSIRLADVAPIRSSYEDVAAPLSDKDDECECTTEGPDGYADLTLKFENQEMVNAIGEVADGEVLALTLTGNLLDGTAIEGKDCIIIISKGG